MYELDFVKIGARICQLRKLRGLSQIELAKKCGISLSFIGHIERGSRKNEPGYVCDSVQGAGN